MVEGGMTCVKYLLFAFNLVFFLFGALLIGIGVYAQIELSKYLDFIPTGDGSVNATAILIIAIGALTLVIGFFGCCGAIKENRCMVLTFAVLIGLILICEIGGGIAAFVMRGKVEDILRKGMKDSLNNDAEGVQNAWKALQKDNKCCGVDGPDDWKNATPSMLDSCKSADGTIYQDGCFDKLESLIKGNIGIVAGVAVGLGVVELLGIVFACCLARAIQREHQYV